MDKIILLNRHKKTFYIFSNSKEYDNEGNIIGDLTVKQFIGSLFPLSNSDLQRLDRGDVSFTDKKIYTKETFKNGDLFADAEDEEGNKYIVVANIDYGYQADVNIYVIRRTE